MFQQTEAHENAALFSQKLIALAATYEICKTHQLQRPLISTHRNLRSDARNRRKQYVLNSSLFFRMRPSRLNTLDRLQ